MGMVVIIMEAMTHINLKLLEMTHVSFPVALGMTLFLFETIPGLE